MIFKIILFIHFFLAKKRYPGVKMSLIPPSTKSKAVAFKILLISNFNLIWNFFFILFLNLFFNNNNNNNNNNTNYREWKYNFK
jgi:hypothetical protein